MAAEYLAVAEQTVALNAPIIFTASIPNRNGCVYHEDETGVFILRGITGSQCFATFQVTFNGNVAIPAGGTAGPIALAITVNGEPRTSSRAIFTPAAVGEYGNLTSTAIIQVPKGCCFSLSVEYVSGVTADPATVPAPAISVLNSNLTVARIA